MLATEVERELASDAELLAAVEAGAAPAFRLWRTSQPTVVVGRGVTVSEEVDEAFCARHGIAIVRRASGGRSVLVGPGTLQYSFALPYSLGEELFSIGGSKRFCNRLLLAGIEHATAGACGAVSADASGDLVRGSRKIAGLALRRRRTAMLLHGTILVGADLALIAAALRHPKQEPDYRAGRSHEAFLANLGPLDEAALATVVRTRLTSLVAAHGVGERQF